MATDKGHRALGRWASTSGRTWLRRLERGLVVVAVVSLGWYLAALVAGTISEVRGERELEELTAIRPIVPAPTGAAARRAAPPAPASVVGRIVIPRLNVSAIVREGVDARTLRRAVGHVVGTALPGERGNAALAAHRDTFFRPLKDVRSGDRILVETPAGTFAYVVRDTRVVEPTELSVLDPTPDRTLTLVTCYPFHFIGSAPQRFIVRATGDAAVPAEASPTRP
jgi:sortase A